MSVLIWFLQFLKPYFKASLVSVLLSVGTISAGIGLLGTSAFLISSAALHPSIAELQVAIVGVRFFGLARGLFRYGERLVSHDVNLRLLANLRTWLFSRLAILAPAGVTSQSSGDVTQSLIGDVDQLENIYVRMMTPVLTAAIVTVAAPILVGVWSGQAAWVLMAGLVISAFGIPFLTYIFCKKLGWNVIRWQHESRMDWMRVLTGLGDLLVYDLTSTIYQRTIHSGESLTLAKAALANRNALGEAALLWVTHMTLWAGILLMIPQVVGGKITGISMAVIVLIFLAAFEVASVVQAGASQLQSSLAAAQRIQALVDVKPIVVDPKEAINLPGSLDIAFTEVYFRYSKDSVDVLKNISLTLPLGKKMALIGVNGSGKSTLFNLLLRFWNPSSGQITLGGVDIRQVQADDLRRMIAWLPQRPVIFSASLRVNLQLAAPGATDEVLWHALELVRLVNWVKALPDGLDTWVGEQGVAVSAGERQRISLARVILQDAPIWLLDEPTSNLDQITEQAIIRMLESYTSGKTVLMATHHLSALHLVEEVVILHKGEIIERGNPNHLRRQIGSTLNRMISAERGYLAG